MVHIAEIRLRKRVKPPQKLMWCVLRVAITFLTLEKLIWWILFPSNIINLQKNLPCQCINWVPNCVLYHKQQQLQQQQQWQQQALYFGYYLWHHLCFLTLLSSWMLSQLRVSLFYNTRFLDLLFIIIWLYWFRYVQESEA